MYLGTAVVVDTVDSSVVVVAVEVAVQLPVSRAITATECLSCQVVRVSLVVC
jgi:hypothetical protein